ncbi:vWA domain-containing protein [Brevibacillus fluminis]|uniref:vWA domain-containing protein n=1 Tax=Brevibacillus fluminis TaxID=511487 RepID=UPI003F89B644
MVQLTRKTTWLLAMMLVLLVQLGAMPQAQAANATNAGKLDAVLVVDVSNSMTTSDKHNISSEAMKMFVDMTSAQGNKIGVVSYTDKIEREKALIAANSPADKAQIKSFIDSLHKGAYTDIAVGVDEAVKILAAGHDPANYPMIVLLADGNNYLNTASSRTQQQSDNELQAAIKTAQANGFPIYTIGLNADGQLNKDSLKKIAADTQGKFFEASTADQLPSILSQIFADHLKLKVVPLTSMTANGQYQDVTIKIPNASVMEANVSIMSGNPVELKLYAPDGKEVSLASNNVQLSRSKAYSMLKIVSPVQGDWKLKVKGVTRDKIDISMVFNYDLQLAMEPIPVKSYSKGDTIAIKAALTENGQKVTSADVYKQMKATLLVTDTATKQVSELPLANTGSGFEGSYSVQDTHRYELKIKAEASSFYRETQPVIVDASTAAASGTQTPAKPAEPEKPFPWMLAIGCLVGAIVLIVAILYILAALKKANKGFIGQVAIEICDEDTGSKTPPQYKKLNTFKGKVKLHQLLQLAPELAETDKVTLVPGKNDTIIIFNRSACTIEKAGRVLDAAAGKELKKNDRIKIMLQNVNKSIYVDYIV